MSGMNLAKIASHLILAGLEHETNGKAITSDCPVCKGKMTMAADVEFGKMRVVCNTGCNDIAIIRALAADKDPSRARFDAYKVQWEEGAKGKPAKLIMPGIPNHDDLAGQLAWLTSVLNLDRGHPVTKAVRYGKHGQDGAVELERADALPLRFEPAAVMNTSRRLLPALGWQLLPTDAQPHGFKDEDCRTVAHVVQLAVGVCKAPTAAQDAAGVVSTFISRSTPIHGHSTYGTITEKWPGLNALVKPDRDSRYGASNYLVDSNTGELAIRVSDLKLAARDHEGSSLPHGWLDYRMEALGWKRVMVEGRQRPGREGLKGPHLAMLFWRGMWVTPAVETGDVST